MDDQTKLAAAVKVRAVLRDEFAGLGEKIVEALGFARGEATDAQIIDARLCGVLRTIDQRLLDFAGPAYLSTIVDVLTWHQRPRRKAGAK